MYSKAFGYHLLGSISVATWFLGEMQRIAFRLMVSSCVCVCLSVCVCVYAAFVDLKKTA